MPSPKAAPSGRTTPRPSPAPQPADIWGNLVRHQLEWGVKSTITLLKSAEAMRKIQLHYANLARERHEDVLERLHAATSPEQMVGLQAELWRFDGAGAARYWQDLFDAAARMNADLIGCVAGAAEATRDDSLAGAMQSFQGGIHTGIGPLDDIFNAALNQQLVTPARTS
jgi:hypothetical protein